MMQRSYSEEVGDRRVNGGSSGGGGFERADDGNCSSMDGHVPSLHVPEMLSSRCHPRPLSTLSVRESRDELSGVRSRLASLRISSSSSPDNVVVASSNINVGSHHRLSSYGIEEEFEQAQKINASDDHYDSISDGEILGSYLRQSPEKQQHTTYGEEEEEEEEAQHSNVGARNMRSSNGATAAAQRHLNLSSSLLGLEKLATSGGLVIHERKERRNGSRQRSQLYKDYNNSGNNGDLKQMMLREQRNERKLHNPGGELISAGIRESVQEIAERSRRSRQQQQQPSRQQAKKQNLLIDNLRVVDLHDGNEHSADSNGNRNFHKSSNELTEDNNTQRAHSSVSEGHIKEEEEEELPNVGRLDHQTNNYNYSRVVQLPDQDQQQNPGTQNLQRKLISPRISPKSFTSLQRRDDHRQVEESTIRSQKHRSSVHSSSEQQQQQQQNHNAAAHQGDNEKHDDHDHDTSSGSEVERELIYERRHHHHHHQHQQQHQTTSNQAGVYHHHRHPHQTPQTHEMLQNYDSSSSGIHRDHHRSMPAERHSNNNFLRRESKNQSWFAATELQSNLLVEVAGSHFYLHKFPLLSRSGRLNRLVFESRDTNKYHIKLDGMPGGAEAFELAAKFCYRMEIKFTPYNVAMLRCSAEYLEMTDSLEDGNLVSKTEHYLNFVVLASWKDSITVLHRCQCLSPWAEDLQITRRCSEAIAWKACTDPHGTTTTHWSFSSSNDGSSNSGGSSLSRATNWDGIKNNANNNTNNDSSITTTAAAAVVGKHIPHDWWIKDIVCDLDSFETFSKVMTAIKAKGMAYTLVGAAISQYAYKWLPGLAKKPKRKGGGGESFTTTTTTTTRDHHHNTVIVDLTPPQHNPGNNNNNNISQNHITTGKEIVLVHHRHNDDDDGTRHMMFITQMRQNATRQLVEGIVSMLPPQQDAVTCNFLLQLLRLACQLDVGLRCRTELERRIGLQLEQASVHDLLIPSSSSSSSHNNNNNTTTTTPQGYSFDIDIVQRIFDQFLLKERIGLRNSPTRNGTSSSSIVGVEKNSHVFEGGGGGGLVPTKLPPTTPHTTKTKVAKLMNSYLAEVARDPNLPLAKFQALAASLPKLPYTSDDGLYRAIDTYLKMHPTMTEHERKKLCRVMDCQRLSLDACLHAAQNERLPLRVVVQVLFSEQVKLRNAITGNSGGLERKTQHHHIDVNGSPSLHEPLSSQAGSNPHILIPRLDGLNMGRVSLEESWQSARSEIKALHHEIATLKSKFSELENEYNTGMSQQMEKSKKLKHPSASGWTSSWRILSSHIKAAPATSNTTSKQESGHPNRDDYSSAPTFMASTFDSSATTTSAIERRRSHSVTSTVSAKGWRNSIS